jgi:hypothetical protein
MDNMWPTAVAQQHHQQAVAGLTAWHGGYGRMYLQLPDNTFADA